MIGIIGAMKEEVTSFTAHSKISSKEKVGGMNFYCGTLAGVSVVIVQCGIGKVNAAVATQLLIDRFKAGKIVFTGLAGSGLKEIAIGDYVLADSLVQHDFDLTHFGREKGMIPATGRFFDADARMNQILEEEILALGEGKPGFGRFHRGKIASGDSFIAGSKEIRAITDDFGVAAVEMEGAAVAQVCCMNEVPFAVLRTVSDNADESALADFQSVLDKASIEEYEILKRAIVRF